MGTQLTLNHRWWYYADPMLSFKGFSVTDLVSKLVDFGFTKTDALVYIDLLKNGRSSGYKIAKNISLSRSTVYTSIDQLYKKGFIFLLEGESKEYEAKAPELILSQIEKKTVENIHILKDQLSQMMIQEEREFVYNITGFDNLVQKARELISQAQSEIYLNTDIRLSLWSEELCDAVERGVRVIVFSFNRVEAPHPKIEVYSRSQEAESEYPSHRFMLVSDMKKTIVFSHRHQAVGIYSNNYLLLKITAEHIHSDIYLTKCEQAGSAVNFNIGTLHETGNAMMKDSQDRSK